MTRHEQQRKKDKKHHEDRISWLTADKPCWACGTPVPKHEAIEMLNKSREALHLIDHGMTTNSAC